MGRFAAKTPTMRQVSDWGRIRNRPMGFPFALHNVNTSMTTGGVAHTKTGWTEVVASTDTDCNLILVDGRTSFSSELRAYLIDYAIGSAGSEVVIAENVYVGNSQGTCPRWIPVFIPIGSRVSIRVQSNALNDTRVFNTLLYRGDTLNVSSSVDVLGTSTADSTAFEFGASTAVWLEMVASTAKDYRALLFYASFASGTMAANTSLAWLGTGAAGAETEIGYVRSTGQNNEIAYAPFQTAGVTIAGATSTIGGFYNTLVPSGTRLSAYAAAAPGAGFGVFVIGIPA